MRRKRDRVKEKEMEEVNGGLIRSNIMEIMNKKEKKEREEK